MPALELKPSRIIATRFTLDREVATGGMGAVYRGRDIKTGEIVAVKLLRLLNGEAIARFAREATLLSELSHPGIVRYIAHGVWEKVPYLVTEWIDGQTLSQRLEGQGLTIDESVAVIARVAQALAEVHKHNLIHRDVKPSNLIFVGKGLDAIKIIDFGVARRMEALGPTRTGMMVGSAGYMSPEQARGDTRITHRADIFSLGCVLYECLTGQAAFDGAELLTVCAKILMLDAPPPHELNPEVPAALSVLTSRMMAKAPASRPGSMNEIMEVLDSMAPAESLHRSRRSQTIEAPTQSLRGRDEQTDPIARPIQQRTGVHGEELSCLIWVGFVSEGKEPTAPAVDSVAERIGELVREAGGKLHRLRDDVLVGEIRCDGQSWGR